MKLYRSGSVLYATGVQASSSVDPPGFTGTGRILYISESHVSGNTVFDIVTDPIDGALWTQAGDEIRVSVSSSTNLQYTDRFDNFISWRFWDTGVKVRDLPGCMFNMYTRDAVTPHQLDTNEIFSTFGFVTAPALGLKNILIGHGDGDAANSGTSWSSLRWCAQRWQEDTAQSLNITTRQGENTFSFGTDLKPDITAPTDHRYNICFAALLVERLDGQFEWTESSTIVNYPHSDGSGDAEFINNLSTDTTISDGDHHVFAFIAVGRGSAGDTSGVKTLQAMFKIHVG